MYKSSNVSSILPFSEAVATKKVQESQEIVRRTVGSSRDEEVQ